MNGVDIGKKVMENEFRGVKEQGKEKDENKKYNMKMLVKEELPNGNIWRKWCRKLFRRSSIPQAKVPPADNMCFFSSAE